MTHGHGSISCTTPCDMRSANRPRPPGSTSSIPRCGSTWMASWRCWRLRPADKTLLAQILSMDGSVDRAALIAKLADKDLQSKLTALLPEIERAVKARRSTLRWKPRSRKSAASSSAHRAVRSGCIWPPATRGRRSFDVPAAIDLYNGNNPLKGKGGRNERVTDEWLKRLSGVSDTPKTRPGELCHSRRWLAAHRRVDRPAGTQPDLDTGQRMTP